jgi:hypothetical protein
VATADLTSYLALHLQLFPLWGLAGELWKKVSVVLLNHCSADLPCNRPAVKTGSNPSMAVLNKNR